jgi:WD40 repeat protein
LWDADTGKELYRFPEQGYNVRFASFSPGGRILASGGDTSGTVSLWDPASHKELRRLQSPFPWLGHLAFSPDGKMVAASADRHRIILWETATGQIVRQLDGREETDFAAALAFSPDSRTLASGSLGETLRLWNLETGREERRFLTQNPWPKENSARYFPLVEAIAFSPDGRTLASAVMHSPVRIWNVLTGKEIRSLDTDRSGSFSLAYSPDGKWLAAGDSMGMLRVSETATGKEVRRIPAHRHYVSDVVFARDGQTLLTAGDSVIRRWQFQTGDEILPDRGHTADMTSNVLLPDQRTLITGSSDGTIRHWELASGKELRRITVPLGSPRGMVVSPDGALVATYRDKVLKENLVEVGIVLWDVNAQRERPLPWQPSSFGAFFSQDGKNLFTYGWDAVEKTAVMRLWDASTAKELRSVARSADGLEAAVLSPDGKTLAAMVRSRESVHLWDVSTGRLLCQVPGNREFGQSLKISPDGKLLAVTDGLRNYPDSRIMHHQIHLWDIATGKEIRHFGRSTTGFGVTAFSPDGRTLSTAGQDNCIRLWELATGSERLCLQGHDGVVQGLMFAEDGRTLISTSYDTTALVWDVTGLKRDGRLPRISLSPQESEVCWHALAGDEAERAHQAVWDLVAAADESVAYLKKHLKPAASVGAEQVANLIRDLDSDTFAVREQAQRELNALDTLAESALRQALKGRPSLEKRRRLEQMIANLEGKTPSGEWLRGQRALEVLEHIGTPQARRVLEELSQGASGARLTEEAKASLERLTRARR